MFDRHAKQIASLLIVSLALGACTPVRYHYFTPALTGVVVKDGQPVPGATLSATSKSKDKVLEQSGRSNDAGRFAMKSTRELEFMRSDKDNPIYSFRISITSDGIEYAGYEEGGLGYAPTTLTLLCDLSRPVKSKYGDQYCSAVTVPAPQALASPSP